MQRRIAINGFGRIGRLMFPSILERHPNELEIVAINVPAAFKMGDLQRDVLQVEKYRLEVTPPRVP